jgi:hypothetical protein
MAAGGALEVTVDEKYGQHPYESFKTRKYLGHYR